MARAIELGPQLSEAKTDAERTAIQERLENLRKQQERTEPRKLPDAGPCKCIPNDPLCSCL